MVQEVGLGENAKGFGVSVEVFTVKGLDLRTIV